ncbi:hypothetical protein ACET3Z_008700 [Daucus carota]
MLNMTGLFAPALKLEKSRAHVKFYISDSDRQIDGLDYTVTYSGLRDLAKRMRDSTAFWESRMILGFMSNPIANAVLDEFTEGDLDLIVRMAYLFHPLDTSNSDDRYRVHTHLYFANSDDQIAGADSPVTYSGLRDLVKRIRGSAAFQESIGHRY